MIGRYSVSNLPSVWFDGSYRVLGCLPPPLAFYSMFPHFGATIPETSWVEIDLQHYNIPILDQGMTSSCVGQGCCAGMELSTVQSGRKLTEFNPYFVYGLINNGQDRGASISEAMMALQQKGICLKEDLPSGVMFKNQFPQKAFQNAMDWQLQQCFRCASYNSICSALSQGFCVPLGVMVGANFSQVDGEGVAPLPNGGGGGHCMLGMGLKKSTRYGWLIKIQNSWGTRFGMNGHCYLRKEHFDSQVDAFAIQVVEDAHNSPDDPPVVLS